MSFPKLAALVAIALLLRADVRTCACDPAKPESMAAHECALCREAESQPPGAAVFFLKDNNPRKPNRWLALPTAHVHAFSGMTPEARLALWNAAIGKARALWGDQWGLAINSDDRRTQCHAHIHIGKLLDGVETPNFTEAADPGGILIPPDGSGFWVHPVGARLHVHSGEQAAEFVLMR